MIAIIDYGAGNLRSVQKAMERVGAAALVTAEAPPVLDASGVILPGVGSASGIMGGLHRLGLVQPILEVIRRGTPFLGVCMGLQVLLTGSEEGGGQECLDVIRGRVRRLPNGLKVPHMGWNNLRQLKPSPLWEGIPDGSYFYFVHSYYVDPMDRFAVAGQTEYGLPFASAVATGNVFGTQFHPEKSGGVGLRVYANFAKLVKDGFSGHTSD